jgi:hypothetical protein
MLMSYFVCLAALAQSPVQSGVSPYKFCSLVGPKAFRRLGDRCDCTSSLTPDLVVKALVSQTKNLLRWPRVALILSKSWKSLPAMLLC